MILLHNAKVDPGTTFPWAELAKQGIGAWPDDDETVTFYLAGRAASGAC